MPNTGLKLVFAACKQVRYSCITYLNHRHVFLTLSLTPPVDLSRPSELGLTLHPQLADTIENCGKFTLNTSRKGTGCVCGCFSAAAVEWTSVGQARPSPSPVLQRAGPPAEASHHNQSGHRRRARRPLGLATPPDGAVHLRRCLLFTRLRLRQLSPRLTGPPRDRGPRTPRATRPVGRRPAVPSQPAARCLADRGKHRIQ